jgi:hypothetical protein
MKENVIYCNEFCREPELEVSNVCCFSCQFKDMCNNKCEDLNCDIRNRQILEFTERMARNEY